MISRVQINGFTYIRTYIHGRDFENEIKENENLIALCDRQNFLRW